MLGLLDETKDSVRLYEQVEQARGRILFEFGLLYLGFALILILASIWIGLWFAERLSRPVGRLAGAAERVGEGDLDVRVVEDDGDDEIAMLGRLFNQMTRQLKGQRDALLDSHRQSERRRRLFDSVLSSVTSGVIGLDADGDVDFVNPAAQRLLDYDEGRTDIALAVAVPSSGRSSRVCAKAAWRFRKSCACPARAGSKACWCAWLSGATPMAGSKVMWWPLMT